MPPIESQSVINPEGSEAKNTLAQKPIGAVAMKAFVPESPSGAGVDQKIWAAIVASRSDKPPADRFHPDIPAIQRADGQIESE